MPDLSTSRCFQSVIADCLSNTQTLDCNAYIPSPKTYAYGWKLSSEYTGTSAFGNFGERYLTYRGNRPRPRQVIGQKFWGSTGWSIFDPSTYLRINHDVNIDIEGKTYGYFYTATDQFIDHGAFEGLFGRCFSDTNVSGPAYPCPCLLNDINNRNWGWKWDPNGVLLFRNRKAKPSEVEGAIFSTTLGPQVFRSEGFKRANPDVQWILNDGNLGFDMHGVIIDENIQYLQTNVEYFIEKGSWESVAYGRCMHYMGNEIRDVGGYVDDYHNQNNFWTLMKHNKVAARYLAYKYQRATHEQVLSGQFWTKHNFYDTFNIDEYLRINPEIKNMFDNGRWLDGRLLPAGYTPIDHFIDYGAWEGQFFRNFNG